jgi:1-acylglycerone phosphate reductase
LHYAHSSKLDSTVPATDLDLEEVHQTFATNLYAVMDINQTFIPLLIQAKGTIVNIGSVAGLMPFIFGAAYNASKAALHSYADTLRVELAPFDVHVVNVITGGVKSNIARNHHTIKPGSLWEGFEEQYNRRQVYSQTVGEDTASYARDVVKGVTNSRGWLWNSNEVWAGSSIRFVQIVRILDRWIPGGLWTTVMLRLGQIRRSDVRNKKKIA